MNFTDFHEKRKFIVFAPVIFVTRLWHLRYIRVTKMTGAITMNFTDFFVKKTQNS